MVVISLGRTLVPQIMTPLSRGTNPWPEEVVVAEEGEVLWSVGPLYCRLSCLDTAPVEAWVTKSLRQ